MLTLVFGFVVALLTLALFIDRGDGKLWLLDLAAVFVLVTCAQWILVLMTPPAIASALMGLLLFLGTIVRVRSAAGGLPPLVGLALAILLFPPMFYLFEIANLTRSRFQTDTEMMGEALKRTLSAEGLVSYLLLVSIAVVTCGLGYVTAHGRLISPRDKEL
jgi:hypothetical protein